MTSAYELRFVWQSFVGEHWGVLTRALSTPGLYLVYLTADGAYLDELNEYPGLEEEYEAGMQIWSRIVPELLAILGEWSGGTLLELQVQRPSLWQRLTARRGSIPAGTLDWKVTPAPATLPALVRSMAEWGWDLRVWTSADEGALGETLIVNDLGIARWVRDGKIRWIVAPGYEGPYFLFWSAVEPKELAQALRDALGLPIRIMDRQLPEEWHNRFRIVGQPK